MPLELFLAPFSCQKVIKDLSYEHKTVKNMNIIKNI